MQGIIDFAFEDCTFQNAIATCVRVAGGTSPQFVNCSFKKSKFGAQCTNGCAPFFKYCNFEFNDNACVVASEETDATFIVCSLDISQSKAKLIGCKIKENKQIGISALNKSNVELVDCLLSENGDNGAQFGLKASVTMKNCRIEKHQNKNGIFVDNANLECEKCIFENNNDSHIKSKSQSTITVTDCEFLETGKGMATQFIDNTNILIKNCKIADQKQVGIISVGSESIKIEGTTIKNCETMGICMQKGSNFNIADCEISDIKKVGVFVDAQIFRTF